MANHTTRHTAGLLRAHDEVDRANEAALDDAPDHDWAKTAPRDLLNTAIGELKSYNPNDDDTYPQLLNGALQVMRLLAMAAPAYADLDTSSMTEVERKVCAAFNVSPKSFLATKRRQGLR